MVLPGWVPPTLMGSRGCHGVHLVCPRWGALGKVPTWHVIQPQLRGRLPMIRHAETCPATTDMNPLLQALASTCATSSKQLFSIFGCTLLLACKLGTLAGVLLIAALAGWTIGRVDSRRWEQWRIDWFLHKAGWQPLIIKIKEKILFLTRLCSSCPSHCTSKWGPTICHRTLRPPPFSHLYVHQSSCAHVFEWVACARWRTSWLVPSNGSWTQMGRRRSGQYSTHQIGDKFMPFPAPTRATGSELWVKRPFLNIRPWLLRAHGQLLRYKALWENHNGILSKAERQQLLTRCSIGQQQLQSERSKLFKKYSEHPNDKLPTGWRESPGSWVRVKERLLEGTP